MRVLTTGARGFIGTNLRPRLKSSWHTNFFTSRYNENGWDDLIYCDLAKNEEVSNLIKESLPDTIIHLAGKSTVLGEENPITANILSTYNLIDNCTTRPNVIYISSATVYGNEALSRGASEDDLPNPSSLYAATKLSAENLLRAYQSLGKINHLTILRPCAVVGPYATHGLLPAIIEKSTHENMVLIGEYPGSIKPYLHVDDLCSLILYYLENPENITLNVAGDGELNVSTIAQLYLCLQGIEQEIKWDGKFWAGDNTLLKLKCNRLPIKVRSSFRAVYDTFNE